MQASPLECVVLVQVDLRRLGWMEKRISDDLRDVRVGKT